MHIDGKKIAEEVIESLKDGGLLSGAKLGVIMAQGDAATESFVRIKERVARKLSVELVREVLAENASTEDVLLSIRTLSTAVQGIIVQLPLPLRFNTDQILSAIPTTHDADALNPATRLVRAPVAEAISEILVRANISALDKRAVVVGAGRLVGAPAAGLLRHLGAKVSVVTLEEGNLAQLQDADIVVSGAGSPGLITPTMLKPGVVLIDAGTSESEGKVVGDATPDCAEVASIFTPVPGGVGPIAVAMLFKNFCTLVQAQKV
jgi:methylenetetrahydrofolate dehydrogenase (NADP+)/methenyltetrahydrofolate cyclohydrolase